MPAAPCWRRAERVGVFAGSRSKRLLIPLLFGVIFIVPVQPWVELTSQAWLYAGLWLVLAARLFPLRRRSGGLVLPAWNHLWFVAYLWVYTMALAAADPADARTGGCRRPSTGCSAARRCAGWCRSPGCCSPICSLLPGARETHDLFGDPIAHLHYLPAFLFGFGLGRSTRGDGGDRPLVAGRRPRSLS